MAAKTTARKTTARKTTARKAAKKPAKKTPSARKGSKRAVAKKRAPRKAKAQIPFVDYLVLGDRPYLRANECRRCSARFFDRRNACASCGATEFKRVRVKNRGEVTSYTIVAMGPYVSAIVDCDGTSVRTTLLGVEPSPEAIELGMKVKLTTYSMGEDAEGTEAIAFGFTPV